MKLSELADRPNDAQLYRAHDEQAHAELEQRALPPSGGEVRADNQRYAGTGEPKDGPAK